MKVGIKSSAGRPSFLPCFAQVFAVVKLFFLEEQVTLPDAEQSPSAKDFLASPALDLT
ncbi:MAG: hypothetical protein QT02_C0010G0012 [archaeon GW2011_AR9]|nr:MAG: hypothetical protein QT02_C0010G0012 [archaeon GW2011_AR9]